MHCQLCSGTFPNKMMVDGRILHLNGRKFCLACSPPGKRNTRTPQATALWLRGLQQCARCKETLPLESFFFQEGHRRSYCKRCDSARGRGRTQRLKTAAIIYKGSQCVICAYAECEAALDFHHVKPEHKDFLLSAYRKTGLDSLGELLPEVRQELDKCVLVCCRCHREIHAGHRTLP